MSDNLLGSGSPDSAFECSEDADCPSGNCYMTNTMSQCMSDNLLGSGAPETDTAVAVCTPMFSADEVLYVSTDSGVLDPCVITVETLVGMSDAQVDALFGSLITTSISVVAVDQAAVEETVAILAALRYETIAFTGFTYAVTDAGCVCGETESTAPPAEVVTTDAAETTDAEEMEGSAYELADSDDISIHSYVMDATVVAPVLMLLSFCLCALCYAFWFHEQFWPYDTTDDIKMPTKSEMTMDITKAPAGLDKPICDVQWYAESDPVDPRDAKEYSLLVNNEEAI